MHDKHVPSLLLISALSVSCALEVTAPLPPIIFDQLPIVALLPTSKLFLCAASYLNYLQDYLTRGYVTHNLEFLESNCVWNNSAWR